MRAKLKVFANGLDVGYERKRKLMSYVSGFDLSCELDGIPFPELDKQLWETDGEWECGLFGFRRVKIEGLVQKRSRAL